MTCLWKITYADGAYTWTKIDVDGDARLEVFTSSKYSSFNEALAAVRRYGYAEDSASHTLMFENRDGTVKKTG